MKVISLEKKHLFLRSFSRRNGRFSRLQRESYEKLYPKYALNEEGVTPQLDRLGGGIVVDFGFGMGQSVLSVAKQFPDRIFIGLEIYRPGIGNLLYELEKESIKNVLVCEADGIDFFERRVVSNSLTGIHIFNPDPWPKKKHRKRRLIQAPFLKLATDKLKEGGYLYLITDWEEYARQMRLEVKKVERLHNDYDNAGGFAPLSNWTPYTKYRKKGEEEGRETFSLFLTKRIQ